MCVCVFAVLDRFLPAVEHVRLSRRGQRQIPRQSDLEARHPAVQQVPDRDTRPRTLNCVPEPLHDSSCSHSSVGSDCSTCSDYHSSRGGTQVAQVTDRLMFVREKLNI